MTCAAGVMQPPMTCSMSRPPSATQALAASDSHRLPRSLGGNAWIIQGIGLSPTKMARPEAFLGVFTAFRTRGTDVTLTPPLDRNDSLCSSVFDVGSAGVVEKHQPSEFQKYGCIRVRRPNTAGRLLPVSQLERSSHSRPTESTIPDLTPSDAVLIPVSPDIE